MNGLPLVLIELKNAGDEQATVFTAFKQFLTYKDELPTLFASNELLVISDGVEARIGTLSSGWEWFKPWKTIEGEVLATAKMPQLQVIVQGIFQHERFLDLLRDFVVFEDSGDGALVKKVAGYHQFHAVRVAVEETLRASREKGVKLQVLPKGDGKPKHGGRPGDRRIGVIWHTQG